MKRISALTAEGTSIREAVHGVFSAYKGLVERVILDKGEGGKGDQVDFLLIVQREVLQRERGGELLLFVVKEVYDGEIVEEGGVLGWWEDERSKGGEMGRVRGLAEQFVAFLREAESEEESEEECTEDDTKSLDLR